MKKRRKIIILAIAALLVIYIGFGFDQRLVLTHYTYSSPDVPKAFDGYKILHISDLECEQFGDDQQQLTSMISDASPDAIVLTGDIIHEDIINLDNVEQLFRGLPAEIPKLFVTGNHELHPAAAAQYEMLKSLLDEYDITDLDDAFVSLEHNGESIRVSGAKYCSHYISQFLPYAQTDQFHILLYHGSDSFDLLVPFGYDLVFSGHAHGGIIRLPIVGGIIGNDGILFPKYNGGIYKSVNSTLVCNRGLAKNSVPRFYNRPELVVVTLYNTPQ